MFAIPAFSQDAMNETILDDEFIITQEFIEAEIVRVRPNARTLTVRGSRHGKTREFKVPETTRITVKGREARLRDLRAGDMIVIAMKPEVDEIVISRVQLRNPTEPLASRQAANPPIGEKMPAQLPKTASNLPAILSLGFLAMLGAGLLRFRRQ
jgi:LPXTG-motif cell wall-anchored protein